MKESTFFGVDTRAGNFFIFDPSRRIMCAGLCPTSGQRIIVLYFVGECESITSFIIL